MKKRWQYIPLTALAFAAFCFVFDWHIADRGYLHLTFKLFGVDFGITRVKAHNEFYWFGQPHTFPLDEILGFTALAATGVAIFFTIRHFMLRRNDA